MEIYTSAYDYLQTHSELIVKINKLKALILSAYDTAEKGVLTGNYLEYWLDDGQSKIKTTYRSMEELVKGIKGLELLLELYVVRYNKLCNGSVVRMVDSKNFRRYCY